MKAAVPYPNAITYRNFSILSNTHLKHVQLILFAGKLVMHELCGRGPVGNRDGAAAVRPDLRPSLPLIGFGHRSDSGPGLNGPTMAKKAF